ncbi:hypothetical protein ELI43_20095, partial [Rhizobium leguminosarum]
MFQLASRALSLCFTYVVIATPLRTFAQHALERRASFRTHQGRSNSFNPRIVLSENRFRFSGPFASRAS